ncbi:C4-dicarboxylate ABC transporter [Escherichia coli]|nr:C4-dicarboxylate ABC transporter [Escherichia coli]
MILISIQGGWGGHIFSLTFRNFLLFTLGPGDRKNYADIH